ncbi:MAG: hypothetical protein PHV52_00085 [Aliarcobacter sp.]|nr:hypothetical protein [Aliarcobacter sp.]
MKVEIPSGAKKMTLPNGQNIDIPDGAKSMDVPDEYFASTTIKPEVPKEPQTPSYNDIGNVHPAPIVENTPIKKESLFDKAKSFVKGGVDEAKRFLHMGADGLETGVNVMNPISPITGELDIVKDTPMKKEFLEKQDENKIDDKLIGDIESLARVDRQLFRDATPEDKKKYMENVGNVLARGGYALGKDTDGNFVAVGEDGKPKAITNGFFEGIIDGLVADKGEFAGAISGAYAGTKLAKTVPTAIGKAATVLGSSAMGAMTGTALDTAISSYKTNQKLSVEDFFNELGKSAVLDVAGNAIGYGVIKAGSKVVEGTKELKDYVLSGNINGARDILKKDLGIDENYIDDALIQAKNQYKEVSDYTNKGITDKAKQQEELLAAVQNDKKFGNQIIRDVVLDDVDAARNVSRTIDARAKNVLSLFDDVKVSGTDIKNSVKEYEDNVHQKYSDMRNTFKDAFSETGYRFDLKTLKFDETLEKLSEKVTDPITKEKFKNLKTTLDNIVYDKDLGIGVVKDFDDLLDIRQMMNKFYRKNQGAFELKPDKDAFFNLVKNIDTEIESSVKNYLPEEIHKPLLDAFDNARMEYKQMYDIADTKLYKSLMADGISAEDRMENLIKHTADDENEFSTLLNKLPGEQQEKIENSIVNTFLEKNLLGQSNEIQAIDYAKVSNSLGKMKDFFTTESGKESIDMIDNMSKKFGNDLELIKVANKANIDTNVGIATTIKGRLEYKIVKDSYDRLMRLIPFSSTAKRLALQEHIKQALQKSRTPMEMVKRVARSSEIPADELASLKSDILDFNKTQRATRQSDLLKIEKEREARFSQAEEELKKSQKLADENRLIQRADELTKNRPTLEELKAMDNLEGGGNGYFFANMYHLDNITPHQAAEYDRALSQYGDKIELKINENKYPINVDNRAKIEQLKDYLMYTKQSGKDDTGLSGLVNPNKYKALIDDLSKGKFRNSEYQKTYYDLLKAYDEFEPKIKDMYDDSSFAPFVNGETLGGAFIGGGDTAFNERDWNNDGKSDEEDVVIGAIGGVIGFKALSKMFPEWFKSESGINANKFNKEKKNILKVAMGEKPSTVIKTYDVESLDNFVEFERGGFNKHTQKGVGFEKIAIRHMQDGSNGFITLDELTRIGDIIRNGEFELKKNGLREYTYWDNDIRYKAIVGENDKNERVVSFYSNRQGKGHNARTLFDNPSNGVIITYKPQKSFKEWVENLEKNDDGVVIGSFMGKAPVIEKSFLDKDGFYSVLEKTINEKAGGKIDSISLAKMLENNGVKEDEIEWSGLKELMSNNEKLTKDEIENTISENRLVIEKVEKTTDAKYEKYKLEGGDNYREYLFKQDNRERGENFKSHHWDEKNILVFTRVDDRKIDNKPTLFIEEIQSDWHQDGRKKGYRGSADIIYDVRKFFGIEKKQWDTFSKDTQDAYIQDMKDDKVYKKILVPNAPFKKNWYELGVKRLIQEAVANDYEKLSWTTGTQQTQRYSLETTADQIIYNKNSGAIQVKNKDKDVFFKTIANDEELENIIGKEIANKLINAPTQNENVFMLKGDELKFGGDGMKSFYDSILPNTVKKLFKKYQVKPKIEELDDSEEMVWSIDIPQKMKEDIKKLGQPLYAVGGSIVGYEAIKEDNK